MLMINARNDEDGFVELTVLDGNSVEKGDHDKIIQVVGTTLTRAMNTLSSYYKRDVIECMYVIVVDGTDIRYEQPDCLTMFECLDATLGGGQV